MTPWPPEIGGKQVIGLFSPCSKFHLCWNDNFYLPFYAFGRKYKDEMWKSNFQSYLCRINSNISLKNIFTKIPVYGWSLSGDSPGLFESCQRPNYPGKQGCIDRTGQMRNFNRTRKKLCLSGKKLFWEGLLSLVDLTSNSYKLAWLASQLDLVRPQGEA